MKKPAANNITKGQAAVELAIFGSIILVAFSILLMYGQRLDSQQQVKMEAFRRALQKAYERNSSVSYTLKKESRPFNLFGGFGQGQASTVGSTASVMWQKGMAGPPQTDIAESYSYYVINDTPIGTTETFTDSDGNKKYNEISLPRYPKLQTSATGDTSVEIRVPASVWNEEQVRTEVYNATASKEERSGGKIINTKESKLKDTIKVTLHTRIDKSQDTNLWDDKIPLPIYEDKRKTSVSLGAYASEDMITDASGNTFKINRIDYSKDRVGTTIHREREWQTEN